MSDTNQYAILFGLPVRLLPDGGCAPANFVAGLLLDPMLWLFGFPGWVMAYEGSYWPALWTWLTTGPGGDDA